MNIQSTHDTEVHSPLSQGLRDQRDAERAGLRDALAGLPQASEHPVYGMYHSAAALLRLADAGEVAIVAGEWTADGAKRPTSFLVFHGPGALHGPAHWMDGPQVAALHAAGVKLIDPSGEDALPKVATLH